MKLARQNLRLIISTALIAVTFASTGEVVPHGHANDERQLTLCSAIESAESATCECNIPILQLKGDISCSRDGCSQNGSVCGTASFETSFSVFPPSFAASVCLEALTLTVGDFTSSEYGPFCIDFGTDVSRSGCGGNIFKCLTSGRKQNRVVTSCKATIAGEQCASCTPCNKIGGVTFDCTNIESGFKVDTCTPFKPWLGTGSPSDPTIPDFEFSDL